MNENSSKNDIDLYMDSISHISILPADMLKSLHLKAQEGDERATRALWLQGTRLVALIAHRLTRSGLVPSAEWLDLVQEGNLSIPKALKSWNPEKGAFTTWIAYAIKGAMLGYARGKARVGGMTGMIDGQRATVVNETDTQKADSENGPIGGDVYQGGINSQYGETPEGYLVDFNFNAIEMRAIALVVGELSVRERDYLFRHYFKDQTQAEIAREDGISQGMVFKVMKRTIEKLRVKLHVTTP